MAAMAHRQPARRRSTHDTEMPAYGLWSLVIINSVVFIFFAFSFFKPQTAAGLALVRRL